MKVGTNRLLDLRVEDAMSPSVVCISVHSTMGEAADLLVERQVSGAPVIDEYGRCVGVLSGFDYIYQHATAVDDESGGLQVREEIDGYRIWDHTQDVVSKHMTLNVFSIQRDRPLLEAAQILCDKHIHRLIVIDSHRRPVGIVSSLDLAAVLLKLVDEAGLTEVSDEPIPR